MTAGRYWERYIKHKQEKIFIMLYLFWAMTAININIRTAGALIRKCIII